MISNLQLISIELWLTITISVTILFSNFFTKPVSINFIIILVFMYLSAICTRSIDYNTDTANYFSYYTALKDLNLFDQLQYKIEPLHLGMLNIVNSFTGWLILEATLYFIFIIYFVKNNSLISTAVVLGITLPLMSSSFRYAVGIAVFSAFFSELHRNRFSLWILSLIGGMAHISLVVTPFLRSFSVLFVFFILLVFALLGVSDWFIERVSSEGNFGFFYGMIGVKSYAISIIAYLYYKYEIFKNSNKSHNKKMRSFLFVTSALFLMSNFYFQLANRFIILALMLFVIDMERSRKNNSRRDCNVFFSFVIFSMIALPQAFIVFINDGWAP